MSIEKIISAIVLVVLIAGITIFLYENDVFSKLTESRSGKIEKFVGKVGRIGDKISNVFGNIKEVVGGVIP